MHIKANLLNSLNKVAKNISRLKEQTFLDRMNIPVIKWEGH